MVARRTEDTPVGRFSAGLVDGRRWRSDQSWQWWHPSDVTVTEMGEESYSASARGAQMRRKKEREGAEGERRSRGREERSENEEKGARRKEERGAEEEEQERREGRSRSRSEKEREREEGRKKEGARKRRRKEGGRGARKEERGARKEEEVNSAAAGRISSSLELAIA